VDPRRELRTAIRHWRDVGAPYEIAADRVVLADAMRRSGNDDEADLELEAALGEFSRLGAALDASEVEDLVRAREARLAAPTTTRKTFVFTDIVGSTTLAEAMGDEAWEHLLRWHDDTDGARRTNCERPVFFGCTARANIGGRTVTDASARADVAGRWGLDPAEVPATPGRDTTGILTAVRDGAAYERLVERVQTGDLRRFAAEVDGFRHEVAGKLLVQVPWSPWRDLDLDAVPTGPGDHPLTIFMEDTAWPHEAMLDEYLEAAHDHYAPSLEESRRGGRALLPVRGADARAWPSSATGLAGQLLEPFTACDQDQNWT